MSNASNERQLTDGTMVVVHSIQNGYGSLKSNPIGTAGEMDGSARFGYTLHSMAYTTCILMAIQLGEWRMWWICVLLKTNELT